MLKKSIRAIIVTMVFCFTAAFSCVNASADYTKFFNNVDKLKWGMTLEEVEAIVGKTYDKVEEYESGSGQLQTLLTYEDANMYGFDGYIVLCLTEENGFEGFNFHITAVGADSTETYNGLLEDWKTECTEYELTGDTLALLHFDNNNFTVFLSDFVSEVQLSFYPLFPKEERAETFEGGNEWNDISVCGNANNWIFDVITNLKWYMSTEEVIAEIGAEPDIIDTHLWGGYEEIQLYYDEVSFKGYDGYLLLGLIEEDGLCGVNFYIDAGENFEAIHSEFSKELEEDCWKYEKKSPYGVEYYFADKNYTVRLQESTGNMIVCSYFPRYTIDPYTYEVGDGGGFGYSDFHEPSPETGNAGAAVYACAAALAGTAAVLTRKKRSA